MSKLFWLLATLSFLSLYGARYAMGSWHNMLWMPLVSFILFISLALYFDRSQLKALLFARTTKYGFNFLTSSILFLAILLCINFIVYKNNMRWDASATQEYSLSTTTKEILNSLDAELQIEAFYVSEEQDRKDQAFALFQRMKEVQPLLNVSFKDPNLYPELVKKYEIRQSGLILLRFKGKQARIQDSASLQFSGKPTYLKEEDFLYSFLPLRRVSEKQICFTEGHREKKIEDAELIGIKNFHQSLLDLSIETRTLRLLELSSIPESCDLLAIIGPELPFTEKELEIISSYTEQNRNLLVAMDPELNHNLARISKVYGLSFSNLSVVDVEGMQVGSNAAFTVGRDYHPSHPITKRLDNSVYSLFPVASYFEIEEGFEIVPLLYSSNQAFSQIKLISSPHYNPANDKKGPFLIAAANEKKGKAVFFADSDFLTNSFFFQFANKDLMMNAVSYLLEEADLIQIDKKSIEHDVLILTSVQANILTFFYLMIPLFFTVLSIIIWLRRR